MPLTREQIALRITRDLEEGWCVNLGVGIPTLIIDHLPRDRDVILHSENGILGMIPLQDPARADPDVVNAGKGFVATQPGASFFDSSLSFAMVRGGHIDVAVVGALQVSRRGDLANWLVPGQAVGGVGGAADIASGVRRLWVAMSHTGPGGEPKIVERCTFPLTAPGVVRRIFTDLAVIDVTPDGLVLREVAPGVTPGEVQARTGAPLALAPDWTEVAPAPRNP